MYAILLVLGLVIAVAGLATVGFGIPNRDFSLGNTLMLSGTMALTGGLILVGLAAVLRQLQRLGEALRGAAKMGRSAPVDARPEPAAIPFPQRPTAPEPAKPSPPSAPPMAAPEPPVPVPDRLRPRLPGSPARTTDPVLAEDAEAPFSSRSPRVPFTPARPNAGMPLEPKLSVTPSPRGDATMPVDVAAPRPVSGRGAPGGFFDSVWPARDTAPKPGSRETSREDVVPPPEPPQPREPERSATPEEPPESQPAPSEERRAVSILKSGVVDGMAYTLYSDGSIEAQLPEGTVRFASITELREHLEKNS